MQQGLRIWVALGAVATSLLLAGCAPGLAERSYPGFPSGAAPVAPTAAPPGIIDLPDPDLGPRAQWVDDGRLLAVSLWGSSSCPTEPTRMTQVGVDYVKIEIATGQGFLGSCTADLAVRTYEIRVPDSITKVQPVTIRVGSREITLARRDS